MSILGTCYYTYLDTYIDAAVVLRRSHYPWELLGDGNTNQLNRYDAPLALRPPGATAVEAEAEAEGIWMDWYG